jgi:hypothetical protein
MKAQIMVMSCLLFASAAFGAPDADEIMSKSYGLPKANDMVSTTKMTLKQAGGLKKRAIKSTMRKTDLGNDSLAEFVSPADVAGTKFLTIGNKKEGDVQHLFLPALRKIRKIASSGKSGKFMGSELSYYDIEEHSQDDFTYTFIKTDQFQAVRNGTNTTISCYVIQSIPKKPDAPYSKIILWIAQDDYFTYKSEMVDKNGELEKTVYNKEVKTVNGIIIAVQTVVESVSGNATTVQTEKIVINSGVQSDIFSIKYLEK